MKYEDIKPAKKEERTHIQRQMLRWHKYWLMCKIKEKKMQYMKSAALMDSLVEKELVDRYKER